MQAILVSIPLDPYNLAMQTGRPAKSKRSPLGERIAALRERAGLSQDQLAQKIGSNQKTVTYWERRAVTLKPAQIEAVAAALACSAEEILGLAAPKERGPGPTGKLRQVFERASNLPRDQQKHVLRVVEDALTAYAARKAG
jgi:transcriptional regulator with XRE-family HTH domain